jgi:xanthine/CO dehydrogenase XdhC/CoxF family maturation factor
VKDLPAILAAHARLSAVGEESLLVTLVHTEGSTYRRPGARMLVLPGCQTLGTISGGCLEPQVARDAFAATRSNPRVLLTVENSADDDAWGPSSGCHGRLTLLAERILPVDIHSALAAYARVREHHTPEVVGHFFASLNGALTPIDPPLDPRWKAELETTRANAASRWVEHDSIAAFLEVIAPPPHLLLCGAGNDAQPVARIAAELGWSVTILDSRARLATADRFPTADHISASGPDAVPSLLRPHSVAVLMSHRFSDDAATLGHLLLHNLPYIGLLGPRRRTQRLLAHLREQGHDLSPARLAPIHSPIGLDLAADSPETIALSILAEIQAALAHRIPTPLHQRTGPLTLTDLPAAPAPAESPGHCSR